MSEKFSNSLRKLIKEGTTVSKVTDILVEDDVFDLFTASEVIHALIQEIKRLELYVSRQTQGPLL